MNYCSKCGKEISDGENKLCDDCKNSLLLDLEKEEEQTEKVENSRFKTTEKEEKKEKKEKSKKNTISKKTKIILCFGLILVVLIITSIWLEISTKAISRKLFNYNKVGITIGNNNNNFGYAVNQGNWIYYMTLSKDASKIDINRIKLDGSNQEVIAEKDWEIYSINAYGKYLYFIAYEPVQDENTYQNNKIYKMSLDGKEIRVINDNNFSDDCKSIYVTNDRIFYIGEDYNIYSMDLEGGNRSKVNDNKTGYIGITDKYILYNDYPEDPKSETDFVTYIMNIDGTNPREVNGQRLYNPNIVGNQIYYVNGDNSEIHKVDINGKNDVVVYKSPAYNMNIKDDYIYYLNYKNENADSEDEPVCIHKIKLDGTDHQIICEMTNYSSFVGVAGNWVYYTDHDDNNYYINMIKNDGKDKITLYTYNMNQAQSEAVKNKDKEKKENSGANSMSENTNTEVNTNENTNKMDNNVNTNDSNIIQ